MFVPFVPISPALCAVVLFDGGLAQRSAASSTLSSDTSGRVLLAASAPSGSSPSSRKVETGKLWVYVGTYTDGKSKGIYLFHLDLASGRLTPEGVVGETVNPSFVTIHPNHRYLYAVNEISNFAGTDVGAVSAFAIDPKTGKLTLLNQQSSRGSDPCHLIVDHSGKNVLVANYGSGSAAVLPIEPDGRLREATAFIQHTGS